MTFVFGWVGSEMAVMGSRKPLMEYEQSKLYMGITPQVSIPSS